MTAGLVDTHCHLTFLELASRVEAVLADARTAGVVQMITVACTAADLAAAVELSRRHGEVRLAAGFHPHEASRITEAELARLAERWQREPGMVAAGEMGLDYHYDVSPREAQRAVFARQLDLAAPTGLPLVIHCREAHRDVVRMLLDHGYAGKRVVFHCFGGSPDEAAEVRSHRWWTSFTGVVTFKNATAARQACRECPADQLMFETDAPYLSPEPVRHVRPNEPKHLAAIVRFAADLRGETFESLAELSSRNAASFFGRT